MKKYIHYGHKQFDKSLFVPIANRRNFVKPMGGLWASATDAEYGWKDWCKGEDFRECKEENSFTFTLSDNAKVLCIDDISITNNLPKTDDEFGLYSLCGWVCLDFEKLKESYDVIDVKISGSGIYFGLYGWDCDSILVMNPDVIMVE